MQWCKVPGDTWLVEALSSPEALRSCGGSQVLWVLRSQWRFSGPQEWLSGPGSRWGRRRAVPPAWLGGGGALELFARGTIGKFSDVVAWREAVEAVHRGGERAVGDPSAMLAAQPLAVLITAVAQDDLPAPTLNRDAKPRSQLLDAPDLATDEEARLGLKPHGGFRAVGAASGLLCGHIGTLPLRTALRPRC